MNFFISNIEPTAFFRNSWGHSLKDRKMLADKVEDYTVYRYSTLLSSITTLYILHSENILHLAYTWECVCVCVYDFWPNINTQPFVTLLQGFWRSHSIKHNVLISTTGTDFVTIVVKVIIVLGTVKVLVFHNRSLTQDNRVISMIKLLQYFRNSQSSHAAVYNFWMSEEFLIDMKTHLLVIIVRVKHQQYTTLHCTAFNQAYTYKNTLDNLYLHFTWSLKQQYRIL